MLIKDMTTADLTTEYKQLGQQLSTFNDRRMKISEELERRKKIARTDTRLSNLSVDEKMALYLTLKEQLGR